MLNDETAVTANATLPMAGGAGHTSALARLLAALADAGYRFITPTPLTHQRMLAHRKDKGGATLRDIFGWNLPFNAGALPPELLKLMRDAGVLSSRRELFCSTVRVASLGDDLFIHSAYPTTQENAVFFGPDTYRFARFLQQNLQDIPPKETRGRPLRVLDVGCGSGAGGLVAARSLAGSARPVVLTMNDINPLALHYTAVNAAFAGIAVALAEGDALSAVTGEFDLIVSNPPYLDDASARAYRHGGARLGRALSVRFAKESLARLAPGGRLLLYTGVAIVEGVDTLRAELQPLLAAAGC
ncbi:MAG: class I SAM-dependent methyltransferase, partial [Polaromonas sp.]